MKFGFNTNGLAFHCWPDCLELIAEAGYQSVAITLDHHCLNPYSENLSKELQTVKAKLEELQLVCVIETGARFLLDPRHKHEPTLISPTEPERKRRIDFLKRSIEIADDIQAEAVSFWAGVLHPERHSLLDPEIVWKNLIEGCREVAKFAEQKNVLIGFEPEPGMFVESFDQFERLHSEVDSPNFGLTVDIGHVHCVETQPISDYLLQWQNSIFNIHIEDMCRGVHEHLRFGEGEIDFPPVLNALQEIQYEGCVNVELSRHSHMAPTVLQESIEFLNKAAAWKTGS